jgi:hypothetical protein
MIGRLGTASERLAKHLISSAPDALEVVSIGEQSEEVISQALQFADFGINTGSPELLGKSGTFAAMCEHNLPVVVGDGKLDSIVQQRSVPPVLQFSTKDSWTFVINHTRPTKPRAGVRDTAADLTRLFDQATAASHSASEVCRGEP